MNVKFYDIVFFLAVFVLIQCRANTNVPLSQDSFRQILRSFKPVPEGRTSNINDTRIIYINHSIRQQITFGFENITSLLDNPDFDLQKPTVFYVHGYVETASDASVLHVIDAYVKRGDHNILVLDWGNLAFGNYLSVVFNVKKVGKESGKALGKLLKNGLSIEGLHVVGHSAGVHVAAVAARVLKKRGFTLLRLTGLDPAFPGFYPPIDTRPICSDDAVFVDIIHTDGGKYGTPLSTGDVDFWPNDGKSPQPGCPPITLILTVENFCSHWRSWRYWAESVIGGNFVATNCANYNAFLKGNCSGTAHMGLHATPE
ncbi:pancreatic lipase-related protein 2-like [Vanessa cardui]|uniref:pancreatic lipase-related protein 2-like n=1 Tax=Vanessa cardui TaxID=171605 RepID=UPI001F12E125|nr:pancreatic lipase-related protein 2-like [Vanessa cardui]